MPPMSWGSKPPPPVMGMMMMITEENFYRIEFTE